MWFFGMGSVENDRMANDTTQGRGTGLGEFARGRFFVRWLAESDFDEFVRRKGLIEGFRDCWADSRFADGYDRFQRVCETA